MPKNSSVTISSEKAKELAEKTLRNIFATRARDRAEVIKAKLEEWNQPVKPSFWGKAKAPKTEQDVIDYYNSFTGIDLVDNKLYKIENWWYAKAEDLANKVLVACKFSDKVTLSLDDMDRLE